MSKIIENKTFSTLKELINYKEQELKEELIFNNCIFSKGFDLSGISEIHESVYLKNCTVKGKGFNTYGNTFYKSIKFEKCIFSNFNICICIFKSSFDLSNCKIENALKFASSTFYGQTKFHKNDFLGSTNIFAKHDSYGSVEFKGELSFY